MSEKSNSGPLVAFFTDSTCEQLSVTDESKTNAYYTAKTHTDLQQLIFHSSQSSEQIASVKFSQEADIISINMNDATMDVRVKNKYKGTEWEYLSPTLLNAEGGSGHITWNGFTTMLCTNESGMTIARLKVAKLAFTRIGSIEFLDENNSQQVKDEIVVTAISLMTLITQIKLMATAPYLKK